MFTPIADIEKKEEELYKSEDTPKPAPFAEIIKPVMSVDVPAVEKVQEIPPVYVEKIKEKTEKTITPEETPVIEKEDISGFKYLNAGSFEVRTSPVAVQPAPEPEKPELPEIKVIGEAFGLYIIVEAEGKLVMIDKHAAHERIIFERLKSRNCRQYSQRLLVGITLLLTGEEIDALENNVELLEDMGFVFDFSEKSYITATALPTFLMECDAEAIICEVAENLRSHKLNPQSSYLDDVLHNMACKAAIKANDKNSPQEMKALAEQVFADEKIRHCPHGRPVMFTMTKANIDHQFKRT